MKNTYSKWNELTGVDFAILPVGSVEQHGKHLPMLTDSIISNAISERLAKTFDNSYLLPLLPFSSSYEHAGFPGSVSLKVSTVTAIIYDIIESLSMSGIDKCIIVNGHQGNAFLSNVAQEINRFGPRVLLLPTRSIWDAAYRAAGISKSISRDMHAGEGETSLLMHLHPGEVTIPELEDVDSPYRPLLNVYGMKEYTDTGAIGFPSQATVEKGIALLAALVQSCEKIIKEFITHA